MRVATVLIVAALLLPSAWLLSQTSDIPQFGIFHDDGLYYVSAESLADGGGYRIMSLPGEPAQTKYPPLYPLLLSIAWRVNPSYPENLPIAAWLSWLAMPAILLGLTKLYPRMGFSEKRSWLLMALFAVNSYVVLFSTQLLTELPFLALVIAAMLMLERGLDVAHAKSAGAAVRWIVAAAVMTGLSYLTRSAGLALLAAGGIYLFWKKQPRLAVLFGAIAAAFVVGWMGWARMHQTPTDEPALFYYLDYFRYHLYNFELSNAHIILWKNMDGLLWGMGSLILPKIVDSLFVKILSQALAVAMIVGIVRLVRRGEAQLYALFGFFSAAMLVVWHFPPNERFVLPLLPLLMAGFLVEADHFLLLLKTARQHPDRSQRVVAVAFSGVVGLILLAGLGTHLWIDGFYLRQDAETHRAERIERKQAYAWIRENTPADAVVLSPEDTALYLNTRRHSFSRPLPPKLWYAEDHDAMVDWVSNVAPFARRQGADYFDFAGVTMVQGLQDDDKNAIEDAIATSPNLEKLAQYGAATVYEIHDPQAHSQAKNTP